MVLLYPTFFHPTSFPTISPGNGNAVLFQNNPNVFTFSMHCSGNYFSTKQVSDKDVEVEGGAQDDAYLGVLQAWLPYLTKTIQPGSTDSRNIPFLLRIRSARSVNTSCHYTLNYSLSYPLSTPPLSDRFGVLPSRGWYTQGRPVGQIEAYSCRGKQTEPHGIRCSKKVGCLVATYEFGSCNP